MNTVAGSGDTEPRSAPPRRGLRVRVLTTLILAPPAVVAVHFGFPWFDLMVAVTACLMGREWAALTGAARRSTLSILIGGTCVAAIGGVAIGGLDLAIALIAAGIAAALIAAAAGWPGKGAWSALGVAWIALPCVSIVWLRADPDAGRVTVLWLLCAVWATDIGAFFAGRAIGGPRLAPIISPGKTWAGLAGGVLSSVVVGAAAAWLVAPGRWGFVVTLGLVSAGLAIVAQAGDLAESRLKRHFGFKDSGGIVPGHGGALDRLDGLLAAAPAIALLHMVSGGSPFAWQ